MWAHLVVLTVLGFAQPGGFDSPSLAPAAYQLEGYLDQAPAGQTVQHKMVIGRGSVSRVFLITKSLVMGDTDPFTLYRNLGMHKPDYILVGPEKPLDSIFNAKPGARLSGTFFYRRGNNDLEFDPIALKVE